MVYEDRSGESDEELSPEDKQKASDDIAASNAILKDFGTRYATEPQRGMFIAAQVLTTMSAMAGVSLDHLMNGVDELYRATVEALLNKGIELPKQVRECVEDEGAEVQRD